MTWLQSWAATYGPVIAGLIIGNAAKYGLTLNEGKPITVRALLADLLFLGILGLTAIAIADLLQLAGNAKVLVGALAAVSSDRLVRLARERFADQQKTIVAAVAAAAAAAVTAAVSSHLPTIPPPTASAPIAAGGPATE